jgi:hypothetical protein
MINDFKAKGQDAASKAPPDRKYSRVCLEQSPVVRTMMLYKRWKASQLDYPRVEVERTELANE